MIQDMINSKTVRVQLNRQTQTYSRLLSQCDVIHGLLYFICTFKISSDCFSRGL